MDFGLREWLFIFGLLVIAGILFDGWRRMGGRSKIRFKLERNLSDLPEEGGNDELLGPPRVVNRNERAEPSFGGDGDALSADDGSQWHEPEQVGLDLDEPPVLVDPVAAEPRSKKAAADKPARKTDAEPKPEQQSLPVELVLVINVVSRDEQGFSGSALHQSILESGLRFGDMNIFHRHESMTQYRIGRKSSRKNERGT